MGATISRQDIDQASHKDCGPAQAMGAKVPDEHRGRERQLTAPGPGGPSEAPAPMLDRYTTNLHTHTTDQGGFYGENPHWCDRAKTACIGQPCRTRNDNACPYEHTLPGSTRGYIIRRKQKGRAYWTILSALNYYHDSASWWLTLTSAPGTRPIEKSWNALRTRIDRTTRQEIITWLLDSKRPGFSRKEQHYCLEFYLGKDPDALLEFKYIAIKTSEGNGVYHLFVFGDMLPASWLRHWWKRYHKNTEQLRIERIKGTSSLVKYALTQYAAGQDKFVRMSHSKDLLPLNARLTWLNLVHEEGFDKAKQIWGDCMLHHSSPPEWRDRFGYGRPITKDSPITLDKPQMLLQIQQNATST